MSLIATLHALLACLALLEETAPAPRPLEGSAHHLVDRGPGRLPIAVPIDEELDYRVQVDIGVLGSGTVGRVKLASGIEKVLSSLPRAGEEPAHLLEVPWIRTRASGSHFGYSLDHELYVRIYEEQGWPRYEYRSNQQGSENRMRHLKIGEREGKWLASYQRNRHCPGCDRLEHFVKGTLFFQKDRHCRKCKRAEHRVWADPPVESEIPSDTVDMLSAVFLARTMVLAGETEATFHLRDKDDLWLIKVARGSLHTSTTPAGRFSTQEVLLLPRKPAGEPPESNPRFEGLFGIRGTIKVFLEQQSGVPVRISGEVPLGPFSIDVVVELESYRGTPPGFGPLP